MSNLTEHQTLFLEQLKENTRRLNDTLNDMIFTKKSIIESLSVMEEYSSAIISNYKKLQKEFRI